MDLGRPNWLCRTHGHPPCNHLLHLPQCSDPGVLTAPQRTSKHKVQHLTTHKVQHLTTGGPSALPLTMQGASPGPYPVLGRPRNQVSISHVQECLRGSFQHLSSSRRCTPQLCEPTNSARYNSGLISTTHNSPSFPSSSFTLFSCM